MQRNTASQKITFLVIDTSTNAPKTGDAANLTAYESLDDGAVTVLTDTSATELDATNAPGMYSFDLTQAETNAAKILFSGKSSTANVKVVPVLLWTIPGSFSTLTIANNATNANVTYAAGIAWGSGAITAASIAADAITAAKIATGAIDADAIADNAIDAGSIATGAITAAKFAAGAIDAAAIADAAIDAATFAAGAITATVVADGTIDAATFAAGAINAAAIADGAIDRATFAADTGLQTIRSNTAQAGAAGSITLDASASAVDNFYKNCLVYLTGGTGAGQYRIISGYTGATKVATTTPPWATNPDNTSTFAIVPRGLSDAMAFNNDFDVMGFFTAMIGNGTFSADFAGSTFPAMSLSAGAITAAVIADNAIDAASIAADAITAAKIAADAGTEIGTAVWASAARTLTAGTNIQLPANGLDLVLVDGKTLPRAIAIIGGICGGKISGAGTGTEVFLGFNGTDVAATVTVDANGNRTAVTY